jgi:HPt (histidine-containing phosphotransfer) domain-containing protein
MSAPRSRAATLLLPRYLEHRARDVAALRLALDLGDFPSVSRIGHNLRGNGKSYGFPEVGAMGEALEIAARAKSAASVQQQLESLEAWLTTNRDSTLIEGPPGSLPASRMRVRAVSEHVESIDGEDED